VDALQSQRQDNQNRIAAENRGVLRPDIIHIGQVFSLMRINSRN
jgi:hypothetical protein